MPGRSPIDDVEDSIRAFGRPPLSGHIPGIDSGHARLMTGHPRKPLSDLEIRKAKPRAEGFRMADGNGLFLWVTPAGGKLWRCRYARGGKEQTLSLGTYPDMTLSAARIAHEDVKAALRRNEDPAALRRATKAQVETRRAETFQVLAEEWIADARKGWSAEYTESVVGSLRKHAYGPIGDVPVRDVTPLQILGIVRSVEKTAPAMARVVRQRCSGVFGYAMATGRATSDPAAAIKSVLSAIPVRRRPARLGIEAARDVLKAVDDSPARAETKLGMRLLALTAVRPGVVLGAPWTEFDGLDPTAPLWVVPARRMKLVLALKGDSNHDHDVPLSRQALDTVDALRTLTGERAWLLPNTKNPRQHAGTNRFSQLLIDLDFRGEHVPHGWRSTFSTAMNEHFRGDRQVIDLMLAHTSSDGVEAAYNRSEHLARRRELAQIWADLLMSGLPPPDAISAPVVAARVRPQRAPSG